MINAILNLIMLLFLVGGVVIFFKWFYATRLGSCALEDAKLRHAHMPAYIPIFVIAIWIISVALAGSWAKNITVGMPEEQQLFIEFAGVLCVELFVIGVIIVAARKFFMRKLRGFGLRFDNWRADLWKAFLCFLAVWPFVLIVLLLIAKIGELVAGPAFEIDPNEGLRIILEYDNPALRILMILFAVVVTPIFEEFVFRGLLQSYLRNFGFGPWASIFFVSVVFSIMHPWMHFPALIILAVCMGYAYEKSNSLLRPIFIHLMFNGISIAFALLGQG